MKIANRPFPYWGVKKNSPYAAIREYDFIEIIGIDESRRGPEQAYFKVGRVIKLFKGRGEKYLSMRVHPKPMHRAAVYALREIEPGDKQNIIVGMM